MASDRKSYRRACEKWRTLSEAGDLSIPAELGKVGIVCSHWTSRIDRNQEDRDREEKALASEASAIADLAVSRGRQVELALAAETSDIKGILSNPEISHLFFVGHGNFSSFSTTSGGAYSWKNLSKDSEHLKTGTLVQRFCGQFINSPSVPFGTFGVRFPSRLYAPIGVNIDPDGLEHPDNQLIRRVYLSDHIPPYEVAKEYFRYAEGVRVVPIQSNQ